MCSSVDNNEKWWDLVQLLFSSYYNHGQLVELSSALWRGMETGRLPIMLDDFAANDLVFVDDNWGILTPGCTLVKDRKYNGYVVIDLSDHLTPIRLDHFCFAMKLAAVFYANQIDKDFAPWSYFPHIDRICLKYSDPKTFNAPQYSKDKE